MDAALSLVDVELPSWHIDAEKERAVSIPSDQVRPGLVRARNTKMRSRIKDGTCFCIAHKFNNLSSLNLTIHPCIVGTSDLIRWWLCRSDPISTS